MVASVRHALGFGLCGRSLLLASSVGPLPLGKSDRIPTLLTAFFAFLCQRRQLGFRGLLHHGSRSVDSLDCQFLPLLLGCREVEPQVGLDLLEVPGGFAEPPTPLPLTRG